MVSLDFDYVLARLRDNCYTVPAQLLAEDPESLLAHSPDEVRALFAMVEEMAQLEDTDMTLEHPLDIEDHIETCAGGGVLEKDPLVVVAETIKALLVLRNNLEKAGQRGVQIPQLLAMADHIDLPDGLLDAMLDAFTEDGELSIEKFPELQAMRDKCQEMEKETQGVLQQVLSSGKYNRYLAEDGYMQFGDRYLLQVKPKFASEVGTVVDETRSGKIVYVEPKELTEITAKLQATRKELKFYARRLFSRMCVEISRAKDDLRRCLDAACSIDLARARLFLGEDIEGEIPEIGEEGIIMARHARNPALMLREGGDRRAVKVWQM
jgi:DNA mismatch repair protein MutS2